MLDSSQWACLLSEVGRTLEQVRDGRYPVVLVLASPEHEDPASWAQFAQKHGLWLLDMVNLAKDPDLSRAACAWPELVDWVRKQACERGGVLVLGLDAFATRWDDSGRDRLYGKLLKSATRSPATKAAAPIVAVSTLARKWYRAERSQDRGAVIDVSDI